MALIIIRLHPAEPVDGPVFEQALSGLTIEVRDLAFENLGPDPDDLTLIGEAEYIPPPDLTEPQNPDQDTGIVQHFGPHPILPGVFVPFSVATAVIEDTTAIEHDTRDLVLVITRGTGEIIHRQVYYNVPISSDALPGDTSDYPALDTTSLYLTLPPAGQQFDPNDAFVELPEDGTPANFEDVKGAIEAVLKQDPLDDDTPPPADLDELIRNLSVPVAGEASPQARCRHVAYEIAWNRKQFPLPTRPTDQFEGLYTNPDDSDDKQARQEFEGELVSFYAKHNAEADRLTGYVFAVSAAMICEQRSAAVSEVRFRFPVQLGAPPSAGKIKEAEVVLTGEGGAAIDPPFTVPAAYFYALGAILPIQTTPDQRYRMATVDDEQRVRDELTRAIELRIIDEVTGLNQNQAARRLRALGLGKAGAPRRELDDNPADRVHALIQAWLDFADLDISLFWNAGGFAHAEAHLDLVLCALTANHEPLITAIKAPPFSVATVEDLKAKTAEDWRNLFLAPGDPPATELLPPFTKPGSVEERIAAFIRHVKKFFELLSGISSAPVPIVDASPVLARSLFDPLVDFAAAYELLSPGFVFGTPLDETDFQAALTQVFPVDAPARAWLEQSIRALNTLYILADVGLSDLRFSIAEALYARGFTSAETVTAMTPDDFRDALTGTVAYDHAAGIYQNAGPFAGPGQPPLSEGFKPINPDGHVTNCVPPQHLSPLGPVAYLHEMLQVSATSTCEVPFPDDAAGDVNDLIALRRGPLGDLHATWSNLATPLPLVDLVNECLEAIVSELPTTAGVAYDTAHEELAGHALRYPGAPAATAGVAPYRHDPVTLFEAVPEHSSPATPVERPQAYEVLRADFSEPSLPYSQPLDIVRSNLRQLGTSRYAAMRVFREEITELVLDPANEPAEFQRHLWRYPVRIDIAREYLGITPEEYEMLFTRDIVQAPTPDRLLLHELYGFESDVVDGQPWLDIVVKLSEFLARTGLTYCQVVSLWQSEFVVFRQAGGDPEFPDCEPCCLADHRIEFIDPSSAPEALRRLAVFIRLWRKLLTVRNARYSFSVLRDICDVLELFRSDGTINPDFIRQLAAFQIMRDDFRLAIADAKEPQPAATGDERTHLLALWVGPSAAKWFWAVDELLDHIQHHAQARYKCGCRPPEFIKFLRENLNPLSDLAGFDRTVPTDTWHVRPTHTLRFAEILAKLYASDFRVGEILFLFTIDPHLQGDDPFPLQPPNEALDSPLDLPDDRELYSLWALRRKLLEVEVSDEDAAYWTWLRIETSLREEFGYPFPPAGAPDPLLSLGEHFFPTVLESAGYIVDIAKRQYRVDLATTSPLMWNTPPEGPFRYDITAQQLFTQLPLTDEDVIAKLSRIRQLSADEQTAVKELYFLPRVDLAPFAFIFSSLARAEEKLIQEPGEDVRWKWFQQQFARCHARSRIIAEHLAGHVAGVTRPGNEGSKLAWRVLQHLFADENKAQTPWESDDGQVPAVTWTPPPNGGAFAALLGLTGTGVLGEFVADDDSLNWEDDYVIWSDSPVAWREVRGPMDAFGPEENAANCPVPTILPAMNFTISPDQLRFVGVRNGFAIANKDGAPLGGAHGYAVHWHGVLLIERDGAYEFSAGRPTPDGERPDYQAAKQSRWRVTLSRGQRMWVVLSHKWPDTDAPGGCSAPLPLKRGAYALTIEFIRPHLSFDGPEDVCPQLGGFQLKYSGPDSQDRPIAIPQKQLFRDFKDATLADGIVLEEGAPKHFLERHFTSTLRDMRRTYERAFKALLLCHRLGLSARPIADDGQSEIGYMLTHADDFLGTSYFRSLAAFAVHRAFFDLNFLPGDDNYFPPSIAHDQRVAPSLKRLQALFDWWERLFDYTVMRREAETASEHPVWLLFHEAAEAHPDDPAHLLRHMGVDLAHAALVLRFHEAFSVSSADLEDERWAIRAWQAEKWLRCLLACFYPKEIREARPDLWASNDPGVIGAGETQSGNQNLTKFVRDGCIENGDPRRYEEIARLNNGLRLRARDALLAYLTGMSRVALPWGGFATEPVHLSELLLLDVQSGICQKASRIEEAISAVQVFVQRARLGLEPALVVGPELMLLWDRHFQTFAVWEACKRREIYRENWIDWEELHRARRVDAFRFLESELRRAALTIAEPGGLEYWEDRRPPIHPGLTLLQAREPSQIGRFSPTREGLGLLGTPERHARPSWLAALPDAALQSPDTPQLPDTGKLPFWMQAAIRLGVKFVRVAAAGIPPASEPFEPRHMERETGCCVECGKPHASVVDEYYFWLTDARYYDQVVQQADIGTTADDTNSDWHREEQLPTLLHWPSNAMVHLAWCRVHNGEFQQPRRSFEGVRVSSPPADLVFLGRAADSLNFTVTGGEAPPGYLPPPDPGFRYDLATDTSLVVPLVATPPPIPPFVGGLPAYPYFVYVAPGAPVMPPSLFAPSVAAAASLRAHCRFEAALKWYELVSSPLHDDNSWCPHDDDIEVSSPETGSDCCQNGPVTDDVARTRAILLHYLETLKQWGDALLCRNSPEAFQQARVIFDTAAKVLGFRPKTVLEPDVEDTSMTVDLFEPRPAPLNPRLLALYDLVQDRLSLIHACLNSRRLRNGRPPKDIPYWGNRALREGWQTTDQVCLDEADWCSQSCCHSFGPYRFMFIVQKAVELASDVRALGNALQAAYEKGDAEFLASLRATQERQILNLTLEVRQNQWRESDWQVQALRKSKEMAQARRNYYQGLLDGGLISGETQYQALTNVAMGAHSAAMVSEAIGEVLNFVPDLYVGFPSSLTHLPVGTKLSHVFSALARISGQLAQLNSTTGGLRLTEAGWDRREDEWRFQVEVLDIEIEQIERQILAAERRRDLTLRELNIYQRQIEHAAETHDFLRDKFTNHALFLWLQQETAALHYQAFELALHTARRAQRAFNLERGHTARTFLSGEPWDSLHEGLLAGDRLYLALRQMEKAYLDENCREYELTKHISLRLHFPFEFLQLRTTGSCELTIPEWMFDLDYPGHYMRRIKNVSLTMPCVVGPYTGIHCRVTLLRSDTRSDPRLSDPPADCCDDCHTPDGYTPIPKDPRIVTQYGAVEAIATSSGQNDTGMFELNFRDERYLPFEFAGAVSRWRIELPQENNQFDVETLSDVILHMNYTAREGGDVLRRAANGLAQQHLPGAGVRFFEVEHEFPDAWQRLQQYAKGSARELMLRLKRNMFPFLPGRHDLRINRLEVLFEAPGAKPSAQRCVEFLVGPRQQHDDKDCACDVFTITCVASEKWPCLYHAVLDVTLGPLCEDAYRELGTFRFESDVREISSVYLFCQYEVDRKDRCVPDREHGSTCMPVYRAGYPIETGDGRCR